MAAGRILVILLAGALVAGPTATIAGAAGQIQRDEIVLRREDDASELVTVAGDDDDGDNTNTGNSGFTSGDDSNDRTGSGHTAVSRDRDLSRGDKTRDRTRDGAGGAKRDWSGGHTNDRSRNDTR